MFCSPRGETGREEERAGRTEGRGEERTQARASCLSSGLSLAHSLFPYTQGLLSGLGVPFAVFQAGITNFKINLITVLLNIFKSKGET